MGPAAGDRLAPYRAKRRFGRTPEPAGGASATVGRRFVVQRHRARRLHYDLRLEVDGVLVSWAVPKGPTLDPDVRRMAVHVEDHPIEYADFEGVIPAGEYGGGDVIVWDRGTWAPHGTDDPLAAIEAGELHADLEGEKLHGRFVLVRRGATGRAGREEWLLLHKHDHAARPGWDPEDHPASVRSGRTNDEVAAAPTAAWLNGAPASAAQLDAAADRPDLAELDQLGRSGTWRFDGVDLHLTNLDKVLFPGRDGEPPLTKRDLVRYLAAMSPLLLPYLRDRAVNTRRFPDGVTASGFWQKEVPAHAPAWIDRWHNDDADRDETQWYVVVDRPATLVWLADQGAVELHPWTSPTDAPDRPTYALFDIDPGPATTWDELLELARLHRVALQHLGVHGAPKVSGRRGIQIWVPVVGDLTFEHTRRWVEGVSRAIGASDPELVSWEWETARRNGRARLDYTQNAVNKTLVAPYGVRAAPGAPVSMPITWEELDDPELRPDRWTIRSAPGRLVRTGDLFRRMLGEPQTLPTI